MGVFGSGREDGRVGVGKRGGDFGEEYRVVDDGVGGGFGRSDG